MKKVISIFLCIIIFVTCFTACSKSEEAKAVEEKINSIGDVTLEKATVIEEAEKAYALLSGEDKSDVKNYDELKAIRATLDELQGYSEKADALLKTFNKIFSEYGIPYSEVLTPYAELTAGYPSDNSENTEYDKILAPVREKYDEYSEIAKKAIASAVSYIKGFQEINKDKEIKVIDIGCIAQINDGTTYYLFAMTYNDGTGEDSSIYATARFAGTPSVETMLNYKDNFYSQVPTSEKTNALKNGNIPIDINDISDALAQ